MFVKSPQISLFPEQFFSPNLAILQSTNWTLKEFAWLVLGATKRKHDGIGRGRRALKSQILSGSQGASGAGRTGILGRGHSACWGQQMHPRREQGQVHGFPLDNPPGQPGCLISASELKWSREKKWKRSFPEGSSEKKKGGKGEVAGFYFACSESRQAPCA